ncbi:MAG TPA: SDR family NAD(P)-dependent oxidoreductase, partial [Beijerinckiaceae bacterium]|nr:SDR family NAD(P)-dependent oxidoreductase [Beijerinckiaceae bacterium]
MELAGKVALVTGAGSGIGKATAVRLAQEGARIGALSDTAEEVEATAQEIRGNGGEAVALPADVRDDAAMKAAVAELVRRFGRLDILVANAGINGVRAPIDEIRPEEWDETLGINLRGTFLTLHFGVPHLKKRGGAIVITSSINGSRSFTSAGATAYTCSKAAQVALAKQQAVELGRHGIRVNVICPGSIDTEIDDNSWARHADKAEVPVEYPEGEMP